MSRLKFQSGEVEKSYRSINNGPEEMISKVDLEKLIQKFRPTDPEALEYYLQDVYKDLSERDSKKGLGLTKYVFQSYYNLPLIICERLFKVLDTNEHSSLSQDDFITGMINLYLGDYKTLIKMMFNMYDYNRDGKINRNDIKIVFNYIPLKPNEIYQRYKIKYEGDNINDRKESIHEINKTLDKIFEEDYIDDDYFKYAIENINSDIFIFLLVYLYEKRPFNEDTIEHYKKLPKKSSNKLKKATTSAANFANGGLKLIVSPSQKSIYKPAMAVTLKEGGQYTKFKSNSSNLIKLKFGSNSNNHLKAFGKSGLKRVKTFNIKKIKTIVDEQDEEYEDDSSLQKKNQKKNNDK
jgi:Ca2+-binding EF-hand superfamily protein